MMAAMSLMANGFNTISRIPMLNAFSSDKYSLYPVYKIIGMSGLIFTSSSASLSPMISGMVLSVTTMSNPAGFFLKTSRAS